MQDTKTKKVTVSFRVKPSEKKAFKEICKANALPMSKVIEMFLLKVIQEGKLPFECALPDRENQMLVEKALQVEDTAAGASQEALE